MSPEVPEGWKPQALGGLIQLTPGWPFKSNRFTQNPEEGRPLIRIRDLAGQTPEVFTPEDCDERYAVTEGEYLIGMDGEFLAVKWHGPSAVLNQRVLKITSADERLDSHFLFYRIQPELSAIEARTGATTVKHLSTKDILSLHIALPPLHEQRRIAEILSSVDEAIAATRAVIEQTRKVKQGVLERLLTKGIGHTRFKQTEIGEIPEGWEAANLFDVLREPVRNGYSPVSPSSPTGGWLLSLGSLSDDGLTGESLKPAPLDDPRIVAAKLSYGDVLISRSNTPDRVGMVGIYKGQPHNCFFPDLMICLRFSDDIINADFGALWLRHLQASGYFKRAAAGTSASMVKINRGLLSQIRIAVPSIGEQEAVVNRMSELQLTIGAAEGQLRAAVSMKAALMSDLLTGRKRVTDALAMAAE